MMDYIEEEPHYLLDSNILSEIIKHNPDFNVISKIAEHNSDCAICAPSLHELLYGFEKMQDGLNKNLLETYINTDDLENFKVKSYSEKACRIHARIRSDTEKIGPPLLRQHDCRHRPRQPHGLSHPKYKTLHRHPGSQRPPGRKLV